MPQGNLNWTCISDISANMGAAVSGSVRLARPYLSTLSHKRNDFRKKKKSYWTWDVLWFSLQLLSETFLILRRIQRYIIHVHRSSRKVPAIIVRFKGHLHFLERFLKILQTTYFIKIRPVGAELLHVNRQIWLKTIIAMKAPKNVQKPVNRWIYEIMAFLFWRNRDSP